MRPEISSSDFNKPLTYGVGIKIRDCVRTNKLALQVYWNRVKMFRNFNFHLRSNFSTQHRNQFHLISLVCMAVEPSRLGKATVSTFTIETRGYAVKVHRYYARYLYKFCNMRQIDARNFICRTLNAHTLAILQSNRPSSACLTANSWLHLTSQEIIPELLSHNNISSKKKENFPSGPTDHQKIRKHCNRLLWGN